MWRHELAGQCPLRSRVRDRVDICTTEVHADEGRTGPGQGGRRTGLAAAGAWVLQEASPSGQRGCGDAGNLAAGEKGSVSFALSLRQGRTYGERLSLEMASRPTPKAGRVAIEQLFLQPGQSPVWTN